MVTEKREFPSGTYYHIYNRGSSKQKIFFDESDKNRFVHLLYLCNGQKKFQYKEISVKTLFNFTYEKGENLIEICAWVLMDNHFHLLVFLPKEKNGEVISKFVSRLTASYLKYFNEKYNRTGALFEGRFQCISVDNGYYLKYLFSYIHLNPLKMLNNNWKREGLKIPKAKKYIEDYKFSSFHDLFGSTTRFENRVISKLFEVQQISKEANTLEKLFSFLTLDPRGSRVDSQ